MQSASRLAARATFGLNHDGIRGIADLGGENWIEQQFALPIERHQPIVTDLLQRLEAGEFAQLREEFDNIRFVFRRMAWWQRAVYARDQLRQRVAFSSFEDPVRRGPISSQR